MEVIRQCKESTLNYLHSCDIAVSTAGDPRLLHVKQIPSPHVTRSRCYSLNHHLYHQRNKSKVNIHINTKLKDKLLKDLGDYKISMHCIWNCKKIQPTPVFILDIGHWIRPRTKIIRELASYRYALKIPQDHTRILSALKMQDP